MKPTRDTGTRLGQIYSLASMHAYIYIHTYTHLEKKVHACVDLIKREMLKRFSFRGNGHALDHLECFPLDLKL